MARTGNPSIVDTQRQGITDVPNVANEWRLGACNGRTPVGEVNAHPVNASADPGNGKLRPRNSGKPDPLGITSGNPHRSQTKVTGASYRIQAKLSGGSKLAEAQVTQANARILTPTHSRSDAFYAQEAYQ